MFISNLMNAIDLCGYLYTQIWNFKVRETEIRVFLNRKQSLDFIISAQVAFQSTDKNFNSHQHCSPKFPPVLSIIILKIFANLILQNVLSCCFPLHFLTKEIEHLGMFAGITSVSACSYCSVNSFCIFYLKYILINLLECFICSA